MNPSAFRRAITDRLRAMAKPYGPWPLSDLQRQFAYDRLLARLYLLDDGWVIKGATALLARGIAVRHTVDIDLYRVASRQHAERDLRAALSLDAGDWFVFEADAGTPIADGTNGVRVPEEVRPFVDPLLKGTAAGRWDPESQAWIEPGPVRAHRHR
ncbi:nucleotidyl transferase AbiEii/AbiGii toxin family protein [Actinomycetes bacterium KLBMP 9797]